jgi:hypothetical protein
MLPDLEAITKQFFSPLSSLFERSALRHFQISNRGKRTSIKLWIKPPELPISESFYREFDLHLQHRDIAGDDDDFGLRHPRIATSFDVGAPYLRTNLPEAG